MNQNIEKSVHWVMGLPDSFVIAAGDMQLLPKMLNAADSYEEKPSNGTMDSILDVFDVQPIFSY